MDFNGVVDKIKKFHAASGQEDKSIPQGEDLIYGRICGTSDGRPPEFLSSDPDKKTVFLFGQDTVPIILKSHGPDLLYELGADKLYLYHQIVEEKQTFWLTLFTVDSDSNSDSNKGLFHIVPASWEGVVEHVSYYYSDVKEDLIKHYKVLQDTPFEEFEREAGFTFLDSKRNKNKECVYPPYFGYDQFVQLPKPRTAWQVRAFLYCELRLLKLYSGDGYTVVEGSNHKGVQEYLCPNLSLSSIKKHSKCTILPLNLTADQIKLS